MGQSCLQKSQNMVLFMMETAHTSSQKLINYYRSKEGYEYKARSSSDFDYEREILLEEDDDDFQAFDYEEKNDLIVVAHRAKISSQNHKTNISPQKGNEYIPQQQLQQRETKPQGMASQQRLEQSNQQQKDLIDLSTSTNDDTFSSQQQSNGSSSSSLLVTHQQRDQEENDNVNNLMNEIENSLIMHTFEANNDENAGLNLGEAEMNEEDQNALLRELDKEIKYEDEDEDDDELGILDRV